MRECRDQMKAGFFVFHGVWLGVLGVGVIWVTEARMVRSPELTLVGSIRMMYRSPTGQET